MSEPRVVKLTDDQFDRFSEAHRTVNKIEDIATALVIKAAEEAAKREKDFWDSVNKVADADSGQQVTINWAMRTLTIYDKETL